MLNSGKLGLYKSPSPEEEKGTKVYRRLLINKSSLNEDDAATLRSQYQVLNEDTETMVIQVSADEAEAVATLHGALLDMDE